MDNTELHYVTYDPDAIWEDMINAYVEAGGDILYPGDEKEMLLRSVLSDIVQVFAGVDNALRMQTIRYAVGEYLDTLGEGRGCERIQATAATATVRIVTNATGESTTLSAGTAMTADGQLFYLLTEDIELSGSVQTIDTAVIADRTGSIGNGLLNGMTLHMQTPNPSVNSITTIGDAAGGQEKEEDDLYRERIREHSLVSVTTGTKESYRSAAMAVSSVIVDAMPICIDDGCVCVYLLLSDNTGSAAIVADVENALNDRTVRPLTDTVSAALATDITYVLNVEYQLDSSATGADVLDEVAEDYQKWQDNSIGLAFNPDKLLAALYQAGATRVIWGAGSHFNNGTVAYTAIATNARCKGTITLTPISS